MELETKLNELDAKIKDAEIEKLKLITAESHAHTAEVMAERNKQGKAEFDRMINESITWKKSKIKQAVGKPTDVICPTCQKDRQTFYDRNNAPIKTESYLAALIPLYEIDGIYTCPVCGYFIRKDHDFRVSKK